MPPASPDAPRLDLVETLSGHAVADPYRWLEDPSDPRTQRWSAAQEELVAEHLARLPERERFRTRLRELLDAGSAGAPAWRGGRAFSTRRAPGQEHAVVLVREPDGRERVLLDPVALDPSGLTTLDAWQPSKEGRLLAYQVSRGGDEESLLSVLDVDTGEVVDGPLDRCRYSPVAWEPAGPGRPAAFRYVRRLAPELVPEGEEQFHRRVYRHAVGTPVEQDVELWGEGLDPTNYYGVHVSLDGRWMTVSASAGTAPRDDVWLFDLSTPDAPPREVQVGVDARCSAHVARDGLLHVWTDRDAPRGRWCTADPERPQDWAELVPEDPEAVLEDVEVLADGRLVVLRSRHAVSELALDGVPVALPGVGSAGGLSAVPEGGDEVWFGWTAATTPPQVLRLDARDGSVSLHEAAPGSPDVPPVRTQLLETTSRDGTTVRMQVITGDAPGPRPTVLYGYGGFGVSLTPAWTPSALAWVEAGGTWVVANLRGGGEEGEAWHRAGMRGQKQNVFDDYAACADALVAQGLTTPEQLGLYGGSNGGLLVGAALTQRPEQAAAVVCSAPLLDMVRYERFGLGRTWNDEYGTAEDPEELAWLLGYSPYHAVRTGTRYPAVLFTVFEGDSRVDPLHARKLCAALQHATTSDRPVLLRAEREVGHGARSATRTAGLGADVLAFLHDALGAAPRA